MDGILGLGHFCETHGPCIILSTQRCQEEPQQQQPHSLSVPWCDSCQSIDLDQSLVSRDENTCYVTTRTPLQQDLAFLLKQAAVRSLSCEETSKEGGTMYFGDNERGHVLSHTFSLQDSLARGFYRKYCIVMLMRDKVHLLNCWPILTRNIKEIAGELQSKSAKINDCEQTQCSQRAVRRQAMMAPQHSPGGTPSRSLPQLTGEPCVYAHVHTWFAWLLSVETAVRRPHRVPDIPADCCRATRLRSLLLHEEMPPEVFRVVCFCVLTGQPVDVDRDEEGGSNSAEAEEVLRAFRELLPKGFSLPKPGHVCKLRKIDGKWTASWTGHIPPKVPGLQTFVESTLRDASLPESVLRPHISAHVLHWHNVAKILSWTPVPHEQLFQSLGVQKFDWPLLAYWTTQCRKDSDGN